MTPYCRIYLWKWPRLYTTASHISKHKKLSPSITYGATLDRLLHKAGVPKYHRVARSTLQSQIVKPSPIVSQGKIGIKEVSTSIAAFQGNMQPTNSTHSGTVQKYRILRQVDVRARSRSRLASNQRRNRYVADTTTVVEALKTTSERSDLPAQLDDPVLC